MNQLEPQLGACTSEPPRLMDPDAPELDFEDFFENGALPLHLVGRDGTILRANKAELGLLGYTADEYVGHPITEFHADRHVINDILARLTRGEKLQKYPARLRAKDGSIRHVEITSSAAFREGQFVNTRCFTVDMTDLKRARTEVKEKESQFRQVLEALPAAVYTTDASGKITYFNRAAAELAGREPEIGKDEWCVTFRLFSTDGKALAHDQCPMATALKENRPIRGVEAMAQRPDGTLFPFLPFPTPIHNADGKLVGAVNMLVDISDRKNAEAQQKMLLNELHHRVKNNMQMLQALLQIAQRDTDNADARLVLADAGQRVAAMAAAQQVLYSSASPSSFNAHDFLHSVCKSAQQPFGPNVTLRIEASSGYLSNDISVPLALILNELLTNAAKHGINARGEAIMSVGLQSDDTDMVLWVQDDGPGFEFQTPTRRSSGLGLICGLARQLGGTLNVERTAGARCTVRFPLVRK